MAEELKKNRKIVNRKKANAANRRYYLRHKKKINKRTHQWYLDHKEKTIAATKKWKKRNLAAWKEILHEQGKDSCAKCGYNKCFAAIEFHHLSPEKKKKTMAHMFECYPSIRGIEELSKCIALCANCHRELHHGG